MMAVYLLIPKLLTIKGSQLVNQSAPSVIRGMMQTAKWSEWMPKETTLNVTGTMVATIQTELTLNAIKIPVEFSIIDDTSANAIIGFETSMENSNWSPIARVQNYLFAKKYRLNLISYFMLQEIITILSKAFMDLTFKKQMFKILA